MLARFPPSLLEIFAPGGLTPHRIAADLAARRVIAAVDPAADDADTFTARVAVDASGMLAVAGPTGIETTPLQPVLDALAASWRASLFLQTDTDAFEADAAEPAAADDDEPDALHPDADDADSASRTVLSIRGRVATGPDRLPELALQLGTGVTAVPAAGQTLVFPAADVGSYWPPAQRPVIEVTAMGDEDVSVRMFTRSGGDGLSARERLARRMLPDEVVVWSPASAPVLADAVGDVAALQEQLTSPPVEPLDAAVAAELGIDAARWAAVTARPTGPGLLTDVLEVLGLPAVARDVLTGAVAPEDLPGAVRADRATLSSALSASILEAPEGNGLWARWRRIPFERPALSWLLVALVAVLAVGAAVWASTVTGGWAVVLWGVAVILAVDAVGDAVLLVLIGRRRRRG